MKHLASAQPGRWPLVRSSPRGLYLPRYVRRFDSLATQVAVFHRDREVVIVAGFDLAGDSVSPHAVARAGVFLGAPRARNASVEAESGARGVLALTTAAAPGLLSVEVLAGDAARAGRERYWLSLAPRDADRLDISQVLLLSRSDSLPRDLEEAIPRARGSTDVAVSDTLGLYWEVYGLDPQARGHAVSLTLVKESAGFLRRAARSLGIAGEERPQISLKWQDHSAGGRAFHAGGIALDLSGNDPGRYTIRVSVTANGATASTDRSIIIRRRPPGE
jgi:hypothetical protein